ncbi:hypothetical protein [Methylobacterium sp.]|uniref:hypothetical protein n=1 Tax=Methylobacterium sp. TaxID=409 RepID=UPI003C78E719
MTGYTIRIKTHDIFAEWKGPDGATRRARVGLRHDDEGTNREIMDRDSFPFEDATIIAVPIGLDGEEAGR